MWSQGFRGFFITININTLIHYFILPKTQPRYLHRCCKWLWEPLCLQVSNVDIHQWVWSFIFIGQPWSNLLKMRSICDGDNEDGITLTLHLSWHRRHHIPRLIGYRLSRYPKSNLAFHLRLQYHRGWFTCWLLALTLFSHLHDDIDTYTSVATHMPFNGLPT